VRDLVVAGGGPVGMAVALHAHRAGLDVVVREPRSGPIDKACGEGLMPGAVAELAALGVVPRGHDIAGIHYLDGVGGGSGVSARFMAGPGRGVRRTVLHAALSEQLAEAGIDIESRPVRSVVVGGDHVDVDGRADALPGGRGRAALARAAGCVGLEADRCAAAGAGSACAATCGSGAVVATSWRCTGHPHAEAYVTPVADDLVGRGAAERAAVRAFAEALARGLPGPAASGWRAASGRGSVGAGPLRQQARAPGRRVGCCSWATPRATSTR
jgi:flavin-dependent dehydrogenase